MKTLLRVFRWLDFAAAALTVGWGVNLGLQHGFAQSVWPSVWVAGGLLGLVVAIWNPSARFQTYLRRRLIARKSGPAAAPSGYPSPPQKPYSPR